MTQPLELTTLKIADHKMPNSPRNRCPYSRTALYRTCGVDLTHIESINVSTALKVISEVGVDLSRFKSVKHFGSWLGLCAGTKISGGKVLSGASKGNPNRLAQALRIAAVAAGRSHSALGAYYHRQAARLGKGKAI